jgi:hypothetical protein
MARLGHSPSKELKRGCPQGRCDARTPIARLSYFATPIPAASRFEFLAVHGVGDQF